ncbi:GSCFA domain-containing protein [Octadecabacter ascidiaceicola]|uniref:GSCFA family protein n=1 Tax=Octadecabacter ascidiaceicola TaxID=1655543 RepID=A0A238K4P7_9RHOB|nr:GSCFA domain-containing protein [Octadecabacter ascidiaceicola]SMX37427.1 GSCFA family protein [Octadecabacter ascidiaceicola]
MSKPSNIVVRNGGRSSAVWFQDTSQKTNQHQSWFRGEHTNYVPSRGKLMSASGVADSVLHGLRPDEPAIDRDTRITAFGSCFAANISNHLTKRNFNVAGGNSEESAAYVIRCGEGMVNTFVLRQQFEWAWEGKEFEQALWHGYKKEEFGYDEEVRLATKAIFDKTEVFILTVGLSEVWYDEVSKNVFWRTIPKNSYDPERHKFRLSTVQENKENLQAIYDLIQKHRPDAKLIVTLSPVPLAATFRDQACLPANATSKAVLRVAIDEFISEAKNSNVFYWPSYELVNDVFSGSMEDDMRHPKPMILDFIMHLFEAEWCKGGVADVEMNTLLIKALTESGDLPWRLRALADARDYASLRRLANRREFSENARVNKAMKNQLNALADQWEEAEAQNA